MKRKERDRGGILERYTQHYFEDIKKVSLQM